MIVTTTTPTTDTRADLRAAFIDLLADIRGLRFMLEALALRAMIREELDAQAAADADAPSGMRSTR